MYKQMSGLQENNSEIKIELLPIKFITPNNDECVICQEKYTHGTPLTECAVCHRHFHSECNIDWLVSQIFSYNQPVCALCRSEWITPEYRLFSN